MKFYYSGNLQPRVGVAVARYLQSPVQFLRADPMGADHEAFRSINPNTLLPVLVEADRNTWEVDAIACRLSALAGSDFFATDHLEETIRWLSWNAYHFTNAGGTLYFEHIIVPRYFDRPTDGNLVEQSNEDFRRYAAVLDETLASRKWLVGNRMTYADFRVATCLPFAERAKLPLAGFSNILEWHDRLNQVEAWRDPFAGLAA